MVEKYASHLEVADRQRLKEFSLKSLNEGRWCLFMAALKAERYFYPDTQLPNDLESMGQMIPHLHNGGIIPPEKVWQSLQIFNGISVRVSHLTINQVAEDIFGPFPESLKDERMVFDNVPDRQPLNTVSLPLPYAIIIHKDGDKNSHIITNDGTDDALQEVDNFIVKGHNNVIAIMEFDRVSDDEKNRVGVKGTDDVVVGKNGLVAA